MTLEETIRAVVRDEVQAAVRQVLAALPAPSRASALPQYLSTWEAADVAGVTPDTIRDWQDDQRLPLHKAGRERRVRLDELEVFLRAEVPAKPRPPTDEDLERQASNIVRLRE